MTARRNPTTLIALAAVTLALATTSFAQTAKNYSKGTINVTPANVSTTTLNGVINSVSGTAVVTITARNVTVTTLSGGTLNVNSAPSTSSVSTTVGAIRGGSVNVNNRGTLNVSVPSGSAVNGSIANSGVVQFNQTSNGTYAGVISGTGEVRKSGESVLTLSGANTYSGGTRVSEGTLSGNTTSLRGTIVNSGVVEFNQTSTGTYSGAMSGSGQLRKVGTGTLTLTGENTYRGLTTVTAGTLRGFLSSLRGPIVNNSIFEFVQNSDGSYGGVISGTGEVRKSGESVLTLSGANTYSGGTLVSKGTLSGNTTSLQGNIGNNATVEFDQSTSGIYGGILRGTGTLRKSGIGVVTFSGANRYTGETQINAGTLFVEGNQAQATGALTVASGATLGGKGTVGGSTTISAGGNHRIGASATGDAPGYQTFANALTYNANSQAFWRLTANTTTAITAGKQNFDQAGVGTTLTVNQDAIFNLAFNNVGSTVNWADPFWNVAKSNSDGWQIFNAAELIADGPTVFTLNPADQWRDSQGVLLSDVRRDYTFVFYKDEANGDLYLNYIYSP
jgi:autotransporter-associated beta strand protein